MQRFLGIIVALVVVCGAPALAACGNAANQGLTSPTPTAVATYAPPTPTPLPALALTQVELLGAPGVTAGCDAPPEATFTCQAEAVAPVMDVTIVASTYARWSLRWGEVAAPLTGDETLALHINRSGTVAPNLYLVEAGGNRIGVNLARFGLGDGDRMVYVPLREVRDADGNLPNFAAVNELQLVFEWADMQGMLALASARFVAAWEEPVMVGDAALSLAAGLTLPSGFVADVVADNLPANTEVEFAPNGDMLVSLQEGRIWWYMDTDGDQRYDRRRLYATGFTEVVGLLYDPVDGAVWIGGRGALVRTLDTDGNGVADLRETRFEGMPWGRHQNNGLEWNPDPDPFSGEPGKTWIYFGLGATGDLEVGPEYNATVLRFPRTGQSAADLEIVSHGNRNAYDVLWVYLPVDPADPEGPQTWALFASENGPDFNDAPDEVNHIRWGRHYGFPDQFGMVADDAVEDDPYSSPVYPVTAHTSANGLAYIEHPDWPAEYRTLYVALFGEVFSPIKVGHTVERIALSAATTPGGEATYRGVPSDFVVGLDRPLPMATGPDGNMIVGDYATGIIYRIRYAGQP